jgi:DNA invertase Pin-like site-specific DNA recombinase
VNHPPQGSLPITRWADGGFSALANPHSVQFCASSSQAGGRFDRQPAARGIKLSLGGQVYDPADPMGKMFFNILATFAEFEVDLLRMRTRRGWR